MANKAELAALALLWAAACAPPALAQAATAPASAPASADARLKALYEAEWDWRQREQARLPDDGNGEGGADDHFPRVDPASQARRLKYWRRALAALDAIPADRLSPAARVDAAVFREVLAAFVARGRFRDWEMPFNADSNYWSSIAPRAPLRDAAAYRRYLGRMRDLPRYFAEQEANMRAGLARGFSVPRVTLAGRDASVVPFTAAEPERNPFYEAFRRMPPSVPAAEADAMRAEAGRLIAGSVAPAYARLLAFLRTEYVPRARTTLAADSLPDGRAFYDAQVREFTTLPLTAAEIHRTGLAEVARIEDEMRATVKRSGFAGDLPAFRRYLRTDPRFYAKTPDELMGVSAYVAKRVDGELGHVLGFLPRTRFTIRPVPPEIAPFYTAGRGGLESCLMNTHDLGARPLYQIPALTLHECAPGHSLQAAIAREGPAKPRFRRRTYFSGYGEGWGLYTEWLGTEMGIYRDAYEAFGRQSYEMWRACRLVIDTGVHRYGWSRDRAIAYLLDHTALSRHEVETEVDRYISWPGQALAYKLGELTIRRLRGEAEAKLGTRFDRRRFHDLVLGLGAVPLPVLESETRAWIARGGPDTTGYAP